MHRILKFRQMYRVLLFFIFIFGFSNYNSRRSIWTKVQNSSRIPEEQKTLTSAFVCSLTAFPELLHHVSTQF